VTDFGVVYFIRVQLEGGRGKGGVQGSGGRNILCREDEKTEYYFLDGKGKGVNPSHTVSGKVVGRERRTQSV